MLTQVLNIDENKKQLILKALQLHKKQIPAAKALGINQTHLNRLTARYGIYKVDGEYKERAAKKVVKIFAP